MNGGKVKKLFAWLLTLALLISSMPVSLAEGTIPTTETTAGDAQKAKDTTAADESDDVLSNDEENSEGKETPNGETTPEGDPDADVEGEGETDPDADAEGEGDADPDADVEGEGETDSDADAEGEGDADADAEGEGDADADAEGEGDADPDAEGEGDANVDAEGEGDANADAEGEGDANADAEGEGDADADAEGEGDADADAEGEGEADPDAEGEGEGDADPDADVEGEGDANADAEGEGEADADADAEGDADADAEDDADPDADVEGEGDDVATAQDVPGSVSAIPGESDEDELLPMTDPEKDKDTMTDPTTGGGGCSHGSPEDWILSDEYIWLDGRHPVYKSTKDENGNHVHIPLYDAQAYLCPICGEIVGALTLDTPHEGDPIPCTFDSETMKCTVCGATCDHTNWTNYGVGYPEYRPIEGTGTHNMVYVDVSYHKCVECGHMEEIGRTEEEPVVQKCIYDVTPICAECGGTNPCKHEGAEWWPVRENESYVNNGDGTHTGSYDLYTATRCSICDSYEKQFVKTVVNETEVCSIYRPGDICDYCKTGCSHPEAWRSISSEWRNVKATPVDGLTHTVTYDIYNVTTCMLCHEEISDEFASTQSTVEDHYSDANGVCYECGYNFNCKHEAAYDKIDYTWGSDTVVSKSAAGHTVKAMVRRYCPTCGHYDEARESEVEIFETHDFYMDVCEVCGFNANDCPHEQTVTTIHNVTPREYFYKPYDAINHYVVVNLEEAVECATCHKILESKVLQKNVLQLSPHYFNEGSNVCGTCGYVKECAHTRRDTMRYIVDRYATTAVDENFHTGLMQIEESEYCLDCGKVFSVTRSEPTQTTVQHNWITGPMYMVCSDCGYRQLKDACKHEHTETETRTSYNYSSFVSQEDGDVYKYNNEITITICLDCGMTIDEKITANDVEVKEPHYYLDGVCVNCGRVNTCAHTGDKHQFTYTTLIRNAQNNGNGTHTCLADVVTYIECDICGETISETRQNDVVYTENHFMWNGRCRKCGFKDPTAPNTEDKGILISASSTSGDSGSSSSSSSSSKKKPSTQTTTPVAPVVVPDMVAPSNASEQLVVEVNQFVEEVKAAAGITDLEASGATIEVAGAEEVMTTEEYQRFDKLSLTEQIMVILSVATKTEELSATVPTSASMLTIAAQTLITDMSERITASGETPFQLEVKKAKVNGVERQTLTITLEVTKDGVTTTVARSFYFDELLGEWVPVMDADLFEEIPEEAAA